MAAQIDHLFSYGPLDVVATHDENRPGLHVMHADMEMNAFIPKGDPFHKEVQNLIEKNPHSMGFVAKQVYARVEEEGLWHGPAIDTEELKLGPSLKTEMPKPERPAGQSVDPLPKTRTLPITGEMELPREVREAMEYRVEVIPLVLEEGSILARPELKPGDKLVAYEVLRHGNALDGLDPNFSPTLDRLRFDARQDPQALEDALKKARELASQKLDMDTIIPGFGKMTPGNREKALSQTFGHALDGWREPNKGTRKETPEQNAQPDKVEVAPVPQGQDQKRSNEKLMKGWPVNATPVPWHPEPVKKGPAQPKFERHEPVPLLTSKNRPLVLDHGDLITVTRRAMLGIGNSAQKKREQAVSVALQAAVERFGQPVHFEGNPAFLKQTAEMAVKMGIQLESGNKLAAEIYQKALQEQEKNRAPRGNVLGPAQQPPKKRLAVQQDQDLER